MQNREKSEILPTQKLYKKYIAKIWSFHKERLSDPNPQTTDIKLD